MEQIFKGTKEFKQEVFEKVQLELNQFWMLIYNANVKQLVDVRGHEYFSYLGQRTQMGEVGSKEGKTLQNAAKVDAETKIISTQRQGEGKKEEIKVRTDVKVYENQKEAEVAEASAELAKKKGVTSGRVRASKTVALRDAKLQRDAEKMNALTQTEKMKAVFLSKAKVEYETKNFLLGWLLEMYHNLNIINVFIKTKKVVEAYLHEKETEAHAQNAAAEATMYVHQQIVDGELYAKKNEAQGLIAITEAQGIYLRTLLDALGGNYAALRDYLIISGGIFQEMTKINAEAVCGVYRMLPPLFKTFNEQTGMLPPAWIGTLPDSSRSTTD
ncbi:Flotillin-like protein 1 [Forsythia ovata]|uniref:Flotillin-like n=1 Tax=Forsythia ovata TaxID=205694 RepID=A0ABD1WFZ5_9LAMI